MKKMLICFCISFLWMKSYTKAQIAGTYYSTQVSVTDRPIGYPYTKYNYGTYLGTFQLWQQAVWHTSGIYYWFEWVDYEKFLY